MTTPEPSALADAIDPRKTRYELYSCDGKPAILIHCSRDTLIAASNALRRTAPTAEVAEVAEDLRDCAYVERRTAGTGVTIKALERASDILLRLSTSLQEAQDRAYEKAAAWHTEQALAVETEHPGVQGSKSQKRRRHFHEDSATAIRNLKGQPA